MRVTQSAVFVKSIAKIQGGGIVVEASNGGPEGPPFVRFSLPIELVPSCHIDKRYLLTIEEE